MPKTCAINGLKICTQRQNQTVDNISQCTPNRVEITKLQVQTHVACLIICFVSVKFCYQKCILSETKQLFKFGLLLCVVRKRMKLIDNGNMTQYMY